MDVINAVLSVRVDDIQRDKYLDQEREFYLHELEKSLNKIYIHRKVNHNKLIYTERSIAYLCGFDIPKPKYVKDTFYNNVVDGMDAIYNFCNTNSFAHPYIYVYNKEQFNIELGKISYQQEHETYIPTTILYCYAYM